MTSKPQDLVRKSVHGEIGELAMKLFGNTKIDSCLEAIRELARESRKRTMYLEQLEDEYEKAKSGGAE